MALPDDIPGEIRRSIAGLRFRIGWHAVQHMFEEGFGIDDMLEALQGHTVVLEEYPEESRALLLSSFSISDQTSCPIHVVCDFTATTGVDIVTAYVPSPPQWVNPRQRGRDR